MIPRIECKLLFDNISLNDPGVRVEKIIRHIWAGCVALAAAATCASIVASIYLSLPIGLLALTVSAAALSALIISEVARRTPITWLTRYIRTIDREVFAFMASVFLYLVKESDTSNGNRPILLVHGYLHNSSAWSYLKRRLQAAGLGPIYTVDLGSPRNSISDYSQIIKEKVKEIDSDKLILIGHSMGGVAASYFAMNDADPKTVTDVFTLGSPLEGTHIALFGIGQCAREMQYQSPFVQELNEKVRKTTFTHFTHFGSLADLFILPHESATPIREKHPKVTSYELKDTSHLWYLYSDFVFDKIIHTIHER